MSQEARKKILVVDDEADAVEFARTVLEEAGYEVATASDGIEGLEKTQEEKPDLVILDVDMPEKDGFAVFAEIRKDPELKSVKVVMLTGIGERTGLDFSADYVKRYYGDEPDAYLEKPVDPVLLQEAVAKLLAE